MKPYRIGEELGEWRPGRAWYATFIVTEDCNLRCSYCYCTRKNSLNRMTLDVARRGVDFLLSREDREAENLVMDFIGGEPLLETSLIDEVLDYTIFRLMRENHKWFGNLRINIGTNGILYTTKPVQNLISKYRELLSLQITVDGVPEKHDATRVYADGSGSYADVVRSVPLWLEQFPSASTKCTYSRKCLPHLKDSILHLWRLGIKDIAANPVFEEDWTEADAQLYRDQLLSLADSIIEDDMWRKYNVNLFSPKVGVPGPKGYNESWCGTGLMVAIGPDGSLYPCVRFAPHSHEAKRARTIGCVDTGIDEDRRRALRCITKYAESPIECIACDVPGGCAACPGCSYESAKTHTCFEKRVSICLMHKARVEANRYLWNRLQKARVRVAYS